MKKYILLFYLFTFQVSQAQENTVYVELLGSSIFYSVNYERTFPPVNPNFKVNGRIGFAMLNTSTYFLPTGLNINLGKQNNFFQLSLNRNFDLTEDDLGNFSVGMGYVRRPLDGLYFHASLLYLIFDQDIGLSSESSNTLPWVGIGIGLAFQDKKKNVDK